MPSWLIEVLNREVDVGDARIKKRVTDILEFTQSIPGREDDESDGYFVTNFWNGWYE